MLYIGQEYQLGTVPECHYRYTGFVWIKHVHKGSTINYSDINFWNGFWMRYEWLQTFQSIWFARMVDYSILCQGLGPGMIFMSKEGIHVTFPRLARYIHTGEQLNIILKIGNLRGGIWFPRRNRVWLFLCNVSLNTVAVLLMWFTTHFWYWYIFPMSSADLTASTTLSDIIWLVSSEYRSAPVSANGFPSSSITSVTFLTLR